MEGLKRGRSPTPEADDFEWDEDWKKRKFFKLKSIATPDESLADFWKGWSWYLHHIKTVGDSRKAERLDDEDCRVLANFLERNKFKPDSILEVPPKVLYSYVDRWNEAHLFQDQIKPGVVASVLMVLKFWMEEFGSGLNVIKDSIDDVTGSIDDMKDTIYSGLKDIKYSIDDMKDTIDDMKDTIEIGTANTKESIEAGLSEIDKRLIDISNEMP